MNQHHFFAGDPFVQQKMGQKTANTTPQLQHNLVVLEIMNNWEAVKDLYKRIQKGEVDLLDSLESVWVQFLSATGTDINQFESPEDFEQKMLKSLV